MLVSCAPLLVVSIPLSRDIERIAAGAQGHVGAAVRLIETGEQFSFHGAEHFPMQSVYKLPIAMAVLHAKLPLISRSGSVKSDLVPRSSQSYP